MVNFRDVCDERAHTLVNRTEVKSIKGNKYCVSTIRLLVDHQYLGGSPIFYETMVFAIDSDDTTNYNDLHCTRYTTLQEAVIGHAAVCRSLGMSDEI